MCVPTPPPLASLVHELRSPLAAMAQMADAMACEAFGPLPPAYADYARLIGQTGRHALAVVAALTDAAGDPEPAAPAAEVVAEVVDALRPGLGARRLEVDLDVTDGAGEAMVPRRAAAQILFNLMGNAARFTAPGGRIAVALAKDGERLRLQVADSGGCGAELPAPGAGLGLDIVRALCAAHGGAFEIEIAPAGALARAWLTPAAP
jgi:cell cycle sensor histidine kinase DivJ